MRVCRSPPLSQCLLYSSWMINFNNIWEWEEGHQKSVVREGGGGGGGVGECKILGVRRLPRNGFGEVGGGGGGGGKGGGFGAQIMSGPCPIRARWRNGETGDSVFVSESTIFFGGWVGGEGCMELSGRMSQIEITYRMYPVLDTFYHMTI